MTIRLDDPRIAQGREVLEEFDLVVRSDMVEVDGGFSPWKTVFLISWFEDLDAGIRGGTLECAPLFDHVFEALVWAVEHQAEIRAEVGE